jgi:hypothetical protein
MSHAKPSLMTLSLDDPRSVRAWSGTTRNMVNALADGFSDLHPGGPVSSRSLKYMFKLNALSRRLLGKETLPHFSASVVRDYTRSVRAHYDRYKPDVVFAPIGAILLDGLPPGVPIIYASDATVRLLFDYNPAFINRDSPFVLPLLSIYRQKAAFHGNSALGPCGMLCTGREEPPNRAN